MSLLLQNATLIDPAKGTCQVGDLLIQKGRIAAIGPSLSSDGARRLDATGLTLAPGLIDAHVHLRDPGQTHKEDLRTGTAAAAAGGFTTVVAMPNTTPAIDNAGLLTDTLARAATMGLVHVRQVAAISHGLRGEALTDFEALAKAGAVAFSDDGRPVVCGALMLEALRRAAAVGRPVLSHAEDLTLPGTVAASEATAVARDICLAEQSGAPVHFCHISTASSVRLIRDAKRAGIAITAETAPHYFTLTQDDEGCAGNPNAKMNPPLRRLRDLQAVREALADGTIDLIATDHAPHTSEEKSKGLEKSLMGITGIEIAFPLIFTHFVKHNIITLDRAVELLCINPRKRFDIPFLEDYAVFDANAEYTVDPSEFLSMGKATPFEGARVFGQNLLTVCDGKTVYEKGTL